MKRLCPPACRAVLALCLTAAPVLANPSPVPVWSPQLAGVVAMRLPPPVHEDTRPPKVILDECMTISTEEIAFRQRLADLLTGDHTSVKGLALFESVMYGNLDELPRLASGNHQRRLVPDIQAHIRRIRLNNRIACE